MGFLITELREAVRHANTSQAEIARASQIQRSSLSRFLSGQAALSIEAAERLAFTLGLTLVSDRQAYVPPRDGLFHVQDYLGRLAQLEQERKEQEGRERKRKEQEEKELLLRRRKPWLFLPMRGRLNESGVLEPIPAEPHTEPATSGEGTSEDVAGGREDVQPASQ